MILIRTLAAERNFQVGSARRPYLAVLQPLCNAFCMVAMVAVQHRYLIILVKLHAADSAPANEIPAANTLAHDRRAMVMALVLGRCRIHVR